DLNSLRLGSDHPLVHSTEGLEADLARVILEAGESDGSIVQVGASVVRRELADRRTESGVILTSLEQAVQEHPELVERYLGTAAGVDEGKFSAQNAAFWTGGTFLYVPANTRVELPIRAFRWLDAAGSSLVGRTL